MTDALAGLYNSHAPVWRRAAVLAFLCALLAWAASSAHLHALLMDLLEAAQDVIRQHPLAGLLVFVLFAALSAMLAFVPAALLVPVALYVWGVPLTMLLLWVGWTLGGCLAYGAGRFLGRRVVGWLTLQKALDRLEHHVRRDTPFALVVLFQLALPSEIPGYVLGMARYKFARYLLALAMAELPYALLTIMLAANFVERRSSLVLGSGLVLTASSAGAFYFLRKKWVSVIPDAAAG